MAGFTEERRRPGEADTQRRRERKEDREGEGRGRRSSDLERAGGGYKARDTQKWVVPQRGPQRERPKGGRP